MLLRFPVLLVWNLLRNVLRFPFVLIKAFFRLFGRAKPLYVRLDIHKELPRWERKSTLLDWFQDQPEDLTLDAWKLQLKKLGKLQHVEGIVLDVRQIQATWAVLDEFRALLQEFRSQGKKVILFFHQFGLPQFYLGTVADKILVSPATGVMVHAPAFQSFFFGALLQELGITMDIQRMGIHKNAPENLTRSFPSPVYRGDLYELLYGMTQYMYEEMARHRQDEAERLRQVAAWGVFSPEEALHLRLVDGIRFSERLAAYLLDKSPLPFPYPEYPLAPAATDPQTQEISSDVAASTTSSEPLEQEVDVESVGKTSQESTTIEEQSQPTPASMTAENTTESLPNPVVEEPVAKQPTPAVGASEPEEDMPKPEEYLVALDDVDVDGVVWWRWTPIRRKPRIAIIPVDGTIVDEKSRSSQGEQAVRSWIVAAIEEAQQNPRIKGVVLWINSPGGSGLASEAVWWALQRLQEKKPVVSFMESYAASGGYYVAVGTQRIFSSPLCLTGSIGVFGGKPNIEVLMQRLKIGYHVVGESPGIRLVSPFRSASAMDQQRWREQLALFYDRFLMRVADNRKMTVEQVHELAQGKVYLGYQAQQVGLVDQCGSLRDAVRDVCIKANIAEPDNLTWFRPASRFSLTDLRGAVRGAGLSVFRHLPTLLNTTKQADSTPSSPEGLGIQTLLAQGLPHTLPPNIPMGESFVLLDMMARGDVVAWSDLRWLQP